MAPPKPKVDNFLAFEYAQKVGENTEARQQPSINDVFDAVVSDQEQGGAVEATTAAKKEIALVHCMRGYQGESSGDDSPNVEEVASWDGREEQIQELVPDYYDHDEEEEPKQQVGRAVSGAEGTAAFGSLANLGSSRLENVAAPKLRHLESVTINLDSFQEGTNQSARCKQELSKENFYSRDFHRFYPYDDVAGDAVTTQNGVMHYSYSHKRFIEASRCTSSSQHGMDCGISSEDAGLESSLRHSREFETIKYRDVADFYPPSPSGNPSCFKPGQARP